MELEGGADDDDIEAVDDEGLVAPKGLDQQLDAEEASRKARGETADAQPDDGEESDG